MIAIHAALFWTLHRQLRQGYSDFTILYAAGRIVRTGLGHQLYEPQTQWGIEQSFAPRVDIRHGPLPYNHAPFEAWIFAPLSGFSFGTAYVIWIAVNLLMLIVVARLTCRYTSGGQGMGFTLLLFLAFFPVFVTLLQGQDSILLLLLYVSAFECVFSNRSFLAGMLLAVGCFKLHLVLPLVAILVYQKYWRVLAGFAVCSVFLFLASVATIGWRNMMAYPHYVWSLNQRPDIGAVKPQLMPNLRGLLDGFLHGRLSSMFVTGLVFVVSATLVLLAAESWRRMRVAGMAGSSREQSLGFSLAVLTTVIVSYHLYAYDATLLLIPILVVGKAVIQNKEIGQLLRVATLLLGVTLFCTPVWALLLFKIGYLNLMCLPLLFLGWVTLKVMFAPLPQVVPAVESY